MSRATFLLFALLTACACDRRGPTAAPPPAPPAPRPAEIPAAGVLTPATPADLRAAAGAASDPAIRQAVRDYLGPSAPRWEVIAARPVGDYVLLWVNFPEIDDDGIDLVYSKKDRRVGWQFTGGLRG
jgi:hypothetical protein